MASLMILDFDDRVNNAVAGGSRTAAPRLAERATGGQTTAGRALSALASSNAGLDGPGGWIVRCEGRSRFLYRAVYGRSFVVSSLMLLFAALGIAVFCLDVLMAMSDAQFWPYDMEPPWAAGARLAVLAGVVYVGSRLAPTSLLWAVPLHIALVLALAALCVALPILHDADRRAAMRIARSPLRNLKTLGLNKA